MREASTDRPAPATTAVQAVRVGVPGKVAGHLADGSHPAEAERHALRHGRTVRRGLER